MAGDGDMRSIAVAAGVCIATLCGIIGLIAGPCMIWLYDSDATLRTISATLINHTLCGDEPVTKGWFIIDVGKGEMLARDARTLSIVTANYSRFLCQSNRDFDYCCETQINVKDYFWLLVDKNSNDTIIDVQLSSALPNKTNFDHIFGWLVFTAALVDASVLLAMLVSCLIGEYRRRKSYLILIDE